MATIEASGSQPNTICDGGAHGYFFNDPDSYHEPLLFGRFIQVQSQPTIAASAKSSTSNPAVATSNPWVAAAAPIPERHKTP